MKIHEVSLVRHVAVCALPYLLVTAQANEHTRTINLNDYLQFRHVFPTEVGLCNIYIHNLAYTTVVCF